MGKDANLMKTVLFGGFKKSDVLSYIEELQTETSEIKEQLDEKRQESLEFKRKIDELSEKLDVLSQVEEKFLKKEDEVQELTARLNAVLKENEEYRDKVNEYESKAEKIKRAEKQIGAAYIDARRYSDELVDGAKMRAKDIGAIASQSVKREANEIEELLKEVDSIARKFNSSIEQLHKDVYTLTSKLNSSASNLLNIHTDIAGLDGEVLSLDEIPKDAVSVSETDDDSGITYISYAPNSEFNEDLNIQPSKDLF